jgi:outer membrane protein
MKTTFFLILLVSAFCMPARAQRVFSLQEAVDTALKNNLELKQTQLQMESSGIDWRQSKANLFPTLNGFANHGINQGRSIDPFSNSYIDQQINYAGYGLATGVTLFNGFGLLNSIKQNSYAYEASKMDVQQQRDNLTLDVILAYLQVMSNEDLLVQAQNQVTVSTQQVERLNKMNQEGAIAPSLLSNLQGELAGNELALVNAQNSLESSRLQLFQLMNVPYDATAKFAKLTVDAFLAKYDATSAEVYQAALDNLAMVKAAGLRKMSSEKGVQAAKGLLFPRLAFNGNVNTNYSSAAQQSIFLNNSEVKTDSYVLVNGDKEPVVSVQPNFKSDKIQYNKQLSNNLYTTVSLDLTVPLFNGFSARNRVKKAALQLKNNTYVEETTKIQLRQSVEQAYANMSAARNRYDALTKQVEAFGLSFRIAEVRFNAGVETAIDYVIAKNNLDRANSNLIIARYDYLLRTKILDYYRGKALW